MQTLASNSLAGHSLAHPLGMGRSESGATVKGYTSDSFNRADGALGKTDGAGDVSYPSGDQLDWVGSSFAVATNQAANTPTLGAELILNGTFAAWTTNNPNNWTVIGESGTNPEISQVGPGEGHGGAGTGRCNFYTSSVALTLRQSVLTVGAWYRLEVVVDTVTSGSVNVFLGSALVATLSAPGTHVVTGRCLGNNVFSFQKSTTPTDVTLTSASVKRITLATMLAAVQMQTASCLVSAKLTLASREAGGIILNLDDPANPLNFTHIWRTNGGNFVQVDKYVNGTLTAVNTLTPFNYVAGAVLYALPNGDNTFTVMYGGASVGSTSAIDDVGAGKYFGFSLAGNGASEGGADDFICRASNFI
jgi:hypothetical protein